VAEELLFHGLFISDITEQHVKNPFTRQRNALTNLSGCKISDLDKRLPQNYSPQI
jgi:hypothetical protein